MKSTLILVLLVALFACVAVVSADTPDYSIISVKVNNLQAIGSGATIPNLNVERGDTLTIEVALQGNATISSGNVPDVRVEAKIIGYEFGTIDDVSDIFTVKEGLVYQKNLKLVIPEDIDASKKYTLRIEASDSRNQQQVEFTVNINEKRHSLNIFDIVVNPSTTIMAGQPLFPIVRVENLGEKKEDDIRVTVSVPELGVSSSNFITDLITEQQEKTDVFRLDEHSSQQLDFLLRIPEDAKSGEYTLKAEVLYNRGHSLLTETRKIFVKGIEKPKAVETLINIDSTTKRVSQNDEVAYKIMFANMGTEKGLYTLQVDGVAPWGQYRVEPAFITVMPDGTAEATLFVRANEQAEPKNYVSVVRIFLGKDVVQEFNINTEVIGAKKQETTTMTLKTVLAVVFIVLIVALVVLGLIIAFRKMKEDTEGKEQFTNVAEGQTYYYYPQYAGNQRRK